MKTVIVLLAIFGCGLASRCGRRRYEGDTERIVGGEPALPHEFPWQVEIIPQGCGGSILSEEWVISAAHCFAGPYRSYKFLFGRHNLSNYDEPSEETRSVSARDVIQHPLYVHDGNYDYDVALVWLSKPLNFTRNPDIEPICLPSAGEKFDNVLCTATGWGRLASSGPLPDVLQKVDVPVWTQQECDRTLPVYLTNRMLCAGYMHGGKDACNGDSGGPLVCPGRKGDAWVLAGITSFGIGCAEPMTPGVYARVSSVLDWIKFTIKQS
ncbi:prostasin-like [Ornithodoros turicata]|uniref:prostasin-like n=1 Tax=Ornithodoros turicata TaxID=34597 RepID=UPI0031397354